MMTQPTISSTLLLLSLLLRRVDLKISECKHLNLSLTKSLKERKSTWKAFVGWYVYCPGYVAQWSRDTIPIYSQPQAYPASSLLLFMPLCYVSQYVAYASLDSLVLLHYVSQSASFVDCTLQQHSPLYINTEGKTVVRTTIVTNRSLDGVSIVQATHGTKFTSKIELLQLLLLLFVGCETSWTED